MWGVVKGFQIACNLAGPLGDLTGKGDQESRKVVHRKGTRQVLTRQRDIQHRRDRTEKAHRVFCLVNRGTTGRLHWNK